MATVYRALDQPTGHIVAIKILAERYAQDPSFVARFRQEAHAAANLSHPNVVTVFDYGQMADGNYYIAMEYVDGGDLRTYLEDHGPLPPAQVAAIAEQICAGIYAAHQQGIVHRDVKPHNILLSQTGRVKVTDFGIARALNTAGLTTTGVALGTVTYFSPEQAQHLPISPASDVYSIGVVMYEMLLGHPPFDGEMAVSVALKHIQEVPPSPRTLNPQIPAKIDAVVMRALEKEPTRRYRDAGGLRAAILAAGGATAPVPVVRRATGTRRTGEHGATGRLVIRRPTTANGNVAVRERTRTPRPVRERPPTPPPLPPRRRRRWLWAPLGAAAGVILALACVMMASGFGVLNFGSQPTPTRQPTGTRTPATATVAPSATELPKVAIPTDWIGLDYTEVQKKADLLGIKIVRQDVVPAVQPLGVVMNTRPNPGELVSADQSVTVFVSGGPAKAVVPDVINKTQDAARQKILDAGLNPVIITNFTDRQTTELYPVGTVFRQSPPADRQVPPGTDVTIQVNLGPYEAPTPTTAPLQPTPRAPAQPTPTSTAAPPTSTSVPPTTTRAPVQSTSTPPRLAAGTGTPAVEGTPRSGSGG